MKYVLNIVFLFCFLPLLVIGQTEGQVPTAKDSTVLVLSDQKSKLDGKFFDVTQDQQVQLEIPDDQLIILDFWSTDCGPCIKEIPDLNKIAQKYSDKVRLISINNDLLYGKPKEKVENFVNQYDFDYPVILDTKQKNLMEQFNVFFWPTRYLVNEDGYFYKNPVENRKKLTLSEIKSHLKKK